MTVSSQRRKLESEESRGDCQGRNQGVNCCEGHLRKGFPGGVLQRILPFLSCLEGWGGRQLWFSYMGCYLCVVSICLSTQFLSRPKCKSFLAPIFTSVRAILPLQPPGPPIQPSRPILLWRSDRSSPVAASDQTGTVTGETRFPSCNPNSFTLYKRESKK